MSCKPRIYSSCYTDDLEYGKAEVRRVRDINLSHRRFLYLVTVVEFAERHHRRRYHDSPCAFCRDSQCERRYAVLRGDRGTKLPTDINGPTTVRQYERNSAIVRRRIYLAEFIEGIPGLLAGVVTVRGSLWDVRNVIRG